MPKVSVLIPIYNVENYIARCATSLFEQTLQDIEYVFVNDCTPDNSMAILEDIINSYPQRRDQIKVIHHQKNKGLAGARNTGFANSCGDYIIHCDSDDWVDCHMYEEMLTKAIMENADIVTCDLYREKTNRTKYDKQFFPNNPYECIKLMLNGKTHSGGCNKLVKRNIFTENHLSYTEGLDMWEDVLMASKTFYFAKRICYINKAFYHYEKSNSNSLIARFSAKSLNQIIGVVDEIENFYREQNILEEFQNDINNLKILAKYLHFKKGDEFMSRESLYLYNDLEKYIFSSTLKKPRKVKLWLSIKYPFLLPILRKV